MPFPYLMQPSPKKMDLAQIIAPALINKGAQFLEPTHTYAPVSRLMGRVYYIVNALNTKASPLQMPHYLDPEEYSVGMGQELGDCQTS